MRIWLIEDDEILGSAVRDQDIADGHAVDWARRLGDAGEHVKLIAYDLILLDLMLPDGAGLDFLHKLRTSGSVTPVIILTAHDQISIRIAGLNAGADDYLAKPFDLSELSARMAAVSRRYAGNPNPLITLGDLEIDNAARSIYRAGRPITLTAREWALFEALLQQPGATLSKTSLEDRLYDFTAEVGSNTIEVHIRRLRKKLGAAAIEPIRGVGYRLGQS